MVIFLSKDEIEAKISEIIKDNNDNDIAFIIASKGVGKINIINELYSHYSKDQSIIVSNGKMLKGGVSNISNSFINGIIKYLSSHNSLSNRIKFYRLLNKFRCNISLVKAIKKKKKDCDKLEISRELNTLSPFRLKEFYISLARDMPLVIFLTYTGLSLIDMEYLRQLPQDKWEARISFVIPLRPESNNINLISDIYKYKKNGIWVFPMLPYITSASQNNVTSFANIVINNIGTSDHYSSFRKSVLRDHDYIGIYNTVIKLFESGIKPHQLFILANQDITISSFEDLNDVIKMMYRQTNLYNKEYTIIYDGKLIWPDAISYYLIINDCIDDIVLSTQQFFFDILLHIDLFLKCKADKNKIKNFLKNTSKKKYNSIANGFCLYFSTFSEIILFYVKPYINHYNSFNHYKKGLKLLENVVLGLSNTNLEALIMIFESSQICSILDFGLISIKYFFDTICSGNNIDSNIIIGIEKYFDFCLSVAYKWNDITLIDRIVDAQEAISSKNINVSFALNNLSNYDHNSIIQSYYLLRLKEKNLKLGGYHMYTVFISYAHKDSNIADIIENELNKRGFSVKRDVRDLKPWGDLKDFMNSIKLQDYVIIIVSSIYLKKENCVYEVSQLLKGEYNKKTFPIVIYDPNNDLFSIDYQAHIIKYWQEYADNINDKLIQIRRENSAELDQQYREIRAMAQNVSVFMNDFFNKKLLPIYGQESIEEIIDRFEEIITNPL